MVILGSIRYNGNYQKRLEDFRLMKLFVLLRFPDPTGSANATHVMLASIVVCAFRCCVVEYIFPLLQLKLMMYAALVLLQGEIGCCYLCKI